MDLIERDREFGSLLRLFTGCQEGRSSVAITSGGVATGKTALLRAFEKKAIAAGAAFLGAVASPTERELPLGVLEQLLRSPGLPGESAEHAARWLDANAPVSPAGAPEPRAGTVPAPALRGPVEILRDLTRRRPVVIGIDDVHYADDASLRILLYLLRRLRSARLLTVLTECPRSRAAHGPLQSDLFREPHARQIRLKPLTVAGVAEMLSRWPGDGRARRRSWPVTDMHAASAGLPPLARALIDDRLARPGPGVSAIEAGEALERALLVFLQRHEFPALEVARAVAILNGPRPPVFLGHLLDIDAGSAAQAVGTLTSAGLLANGRFRHDAVRTAVVNGIPPGERMALHDRTAALLRTEGAAATEVAAHIVAANDTEAPWAIPILREAAEHALADDDPGTGIRYLRTAYRMSTDRRRRAAIATALAAAEWRVDPAAVLRRLPECSAAVHEDLVDAREAVTTVTSLLWHGRVPEAQGLLDAIDRKRGAAAEGWTGAPGDLGSPGLWLSYLYPELSRDRSRPLFGGKEGDPVASAEAVLERSRLSHQTFVPLSIALATLLYDDRLDRAAAWSSTLVEEAAARHSPTWRALFTSLGALIRFRRGELAAAEEQARTALDLIAPKSWGVVVGLPVACLVLAKVSAGRVHEAADVLDAHVPDAMFRTPAGVHYLHARGRYHLAAGRFHAALHDFRACGKLMTGWGLDLPSLEPWRAGAARALLSLGEPLAARRLAEEQIALASPRHPRTHGISLRALAATHDPQDRPPLLENAVKLLRDCGDLLELSQALTDLSEAYEETGEHERAVERARKARVLLRQCETGIRNESPVHGIGGGQPAEPSGDLAHAHLYVKLSEAEMRVAALAADGYTNREISQKLFITVSTVEQHLTKVYRKLNVKRLDLKSALREMSGRERRTGMRDEERHEARRPAPLLCAQPFRNL